MPCSGERQLLFDTYTARLKSTLPCDDPNAIYGMNTEVLQKRTEQRTLASVPLQHAAQASRASTRKRTVTQAHTCTHMQIADKHIRANGKCLAVHRHVQHMKTRTYLLLPLSIGACLGACNYDEYIYYITARAVLYRQVSQRRRQPTYEVMLASAASAE